MSKISKKEVQMSIKLESDLRDQFMAEAAKAHRPAAQILRELMRFYIERQRIPNAATRNVIDELERGKGKQFTSANGLFEDLGM